MHETRWQEMDVPILMYHHVVPGTTVPPNLMYTVPLELFERQLDILKRNRFATISFAELFRIASGAMQPPARRLVVISFDDGYQSFIKLAVPALVKRQMRATVFVVAGEIGGHNRWDVERGHPRLDLMTEPEIRESLAAGMEIGVHSWTHRAMTSCGAQELEREMVEAKREIDRRFGITTEAFAYPYGDYAPEHFPVLARAGYAGAACIYSGDARVTSERYSMRRVLVHDGDGPIRFRFKLSRLFLRLRARVDPGYVGRN